MLTRHSTELTDPGWSHRWRKAVPHWRNSSENDGLIWPHFGGVALRRFPMVVLILTGNTLRWFGRPHRRRAVTPTGHLPRARRSGE